MPTNMKVVVAHGFLHIAKHTCECDKQDRYSSVVRGLTEKACCRPRSPYRTTRTLHATETLSYRELWGGIAKADARTSKHARCGSISRSLTDFA